MTKVRLCFHDRCFDGTASAALFYRFYRERFDQTADFGFTGMTHRAAQPWEAGLFDGDENVIVDFKFSNSPKVTWWFDHHQSAFLTPADAEQFRKQPGPHMFYEPDYKSCTKLIATIAKKKFGFDIKPLADLIHWGDIIDGAQYPTPQSAVELAEPATQLALVIEAAPENGLPAKIIPELAYRPLSEMVKLPLVAKHLGPLLERHRKSIEILRERIEARDGVIFFDVSDLDLEGYNKFIPYLLHPECVYSVSVSASAVRAKVSLGTNPWNQAAANQNLASLAEKFGGGGHPRVSAISFEPGDLQRAREVARGLASTLRA
ncbi:MAG: phosphoesterase [Acidobacteria bacterium 13_2_20CM_57_17]|nr:MAG: phosphoesterase [Acidobacteria bacterium 13_2_20CM_57_17]